MSTTTQAVVMDAIERAVLKGGATLVVNSGIAYNAGTMMALKPGDLGSAAVVHFNFQNSTVMLCSFKESQKRPLPTLTPPLRQRLSVSVTENDDLAALVAAAVEYMLGGRA
jgi:hypothetical protein